MLSAAAEQLYEAARARLNRGGATAPATKTLFLTSARLHNSARQLLLSGDAGATPASVRTSGAALPRRHRRAWFESVRVTAYDDDEPQFVTKNDVMTVVIDF